MRLFNVRGALGTLSRSIYNPTRFRNMHMATPAPSQSRLPTILVVSVPLWLPSSSCRIRGQIPWFGRWSNKRPSNCFRLVAGIGLEFFWLLLLGFFHFGFSWPGLGWVASIGFKNLTGKTATGVHKGEGNGVWCYYLYFWVTKYQFLFIEEIDH